MKISADLFVSYAHNNNNTVKTNSNVEVKNFNNTKLISYPANYYLPVSFGKIFPLNLTEAYWKKLHKEKLKG